MNQVRPSGLPLYHAELDTANFTFEAVAYNEEAAREAVLDGLSKHLAQRVGGDGLLFAAWAEEVHICKMEAGRCYRDHGKEGTGPL